MLAFGQPGFRARSRPRPGHRPRPAAPGALGSLFVAGWRTCPLPCERWQGGRAGPMPGDAGIRHSGFQDRSRSRLALRLPSLFGRCFLLPGGPGGWRACSYAIWAGFPGSARSLGQEEGLATAGSTNFTRAAFAKNIISNYNTHSIFRKLLTTSITTGK